MKEFLFKGIKLSLVSKEEFRKIIGKSKPTLNRWIRDGLLPNPTFQDDNKIYRINGGDHSAKFYVYQEAIIVKTLLRAKLDIIEFNEQYHEEINKFRDKVADGSVDLLSYPLILEFSNFEDLKDYFSDMGLEIPDSKLEFIYKNGDKIKSKERINGSEKSKKSSPKEKTKRDKT